MAKGAGFKTILAAVKEASYGTALAVTEMIPFLSEGITHDQTRSPDMSLIGEAGFNRTFTKPAEYGGPIELSLDYGGLDLLIAAALGSAGSPNLFAGNDLYENTYELTADVDVSLTLAANKDVEDGTGLLHEWPGDKIDKLTIKGEAGSDAPVSVTIDTVAEHHYTTADGSITNTKSDISAATLLDVPVTMFEDMVFSIGAITAALDGDDAMCIGDFELVIDNGLRRLQTNCGLAEPERDKRRVITFSIGIPSYTSDQFNTWRNNNTELQARLRFTRDVSGVTDTYYNEIRLGKIQVSDFQTPTEGETIIAPKVEFSIIRATTDNQTWTLMTEELEYYVINGRSTSPLA